MQNPNVKLTFGIIKPHAVAAAAEKLAALEAAGIRVVKSPADIGSGMKESLGAGSAA